MLNFIQRYRTYIGIFLVLVILAGGLILFWNAKKGQKDIVKNQIRVDIEGGVQNPGVYNFQSGAIIEDVIAAAGGLTEQVDVERLAKEINRAERLRDGQKILVPVIGQVAGEKEAADNATIQTSSEKININTASLEELDTLPGIGPAYAQRIIDYREEHGGFESIEDLQNISGIGPKTMEKLRDLITI